MPDRALRHALDRDMICSVMHLNQLAPWPLALLIFAVLQSDVPNNRLSLAVLWCISILSLHAIRWYLIRQWSQFGDARLSSVMRWVRLLALANALLLSSVVAFFPDFTLAERGFATLVITGMGSGVVSMTNGRPPHSEPSYCRQRLC